MRSPFSNDNSQILSGYVGVPSGTTTVRLGSGQTMALGDFYDGCQYAVAEFGSGDTDTLDAFVNGRGASVPGGTRNALRIDNNTPRGGGMGLPPSWEMWVYSISYELVRATGATTFAGYSEPVRQTVAFDLTRKLYAEYLYNSTFYVQGSILDNPQGVGLSLSGTTNDVQIVNNGVPDPRARISMELPLHEERDISYSSQVTPMSALTIAQTGVDASLTSLTTVDLKVRKYGIIRRNVGAGGTGTAGMPA